MADRFPLIVNEVSRKIEELVSGDNLNLTDNGISINGGVGVNGQFLQSTGSKVIWAFPENTVTKIKAGDTGTFISGEISFVAGPSGNISIDQNGGIITIDSVNSVTRFRATELGTYVDGDITIIGTGNTTISQSGRTIIVDSNFTQVKSDWNAINSAAEILNKPIVPKVPTVETSPASGSGSLSYDSFTGVFTFTPADLTGLATNGNQTNWDTAYSWGDHASAGYLVGLPSRTTSQATATSVANNGSSDISITTPATYALLKIQTSHAAWVTLYTDTTSRSNDSARTEQTDPIPGSGVLAEVITSGATTQMITPGTIGFNSAGTGTTYAKIVNKSGTTANITVTLHYVQLEG